MPPATASLEANPADEKHVVATMASTSDQAVGSDLEQLPARDGEPSDATTPTGKRNDQSSPVTLDAGLPTPSTARPAYVTAGTSPAADAAWPQQIVHVVSNGDTLEKLAERYLGDAGRALELFDLNRDQLANPHLLPIGAELRIPVPPRTEPD